MVGKRGRARVESAEKRDQRLALAVRVTCTCVSVPTCVCVPHGHSGDTSTEEIGLGLQKDTWQIAICATCRTKKNSIDL